MRSVRQEARPPPLHKIVDRRGEGRREGQGRTGPVGPPGLVIVGTVPDGPGGGGRVAEEGGAEGELAERALAVGDGGEECEEEVVAEEDGGAALGGGVGCGRWWGGCGVGGGRVWDRWVLGWVEALDRVFCVCACCADYGEVLVPVEPFFVLVAGAAGGGLAFSGVLVQSA